MARSFGNITGKARIVVDICDALLCLVLAAACAYLAAGGFYVAPQVQADPENLDLRGELMWAAMLSHSDMIGGGGSYHRAYLHSLSHIAGVVYLRDMTGSQSDLVSV